MLKIFVINRKFQVTIGNTLLNRYEVDIGIAQGNVISPILFFIMIDDVFQNVGNDFLKALLTDDGQIFKKNAASNTLFQFTVDRAKSN